jgi:hypothetical protein
VNFFLAFKSQFAPKCKRWHHGIGTLNGGKPQKKPKRYQLRKGKANCATHTEDTYDVGARANQGEVARPEPPRLQ